MVRVVASAGLLFAIAGILSAQEGDLKQLEGTYAVTSMVHEGKEAEKELIQKVKFVFKGDTLSVAIGEEMKKARIKVDTAKMPYTIDITPSEGNDKGKTFPGIYKVDKGDVTIAFTEKGGRPKEFKSDENVVLVKLKKE